MIHKTKVFLEMIKFEHSIFALPFAYLGFIFAAKERATGIYLTDSRLLIQLFWVTVAMISLRTAGMCLNRLIDHTTDAENPRTKNRALPLGLLKRSVVWAVVVVTHVLFVLSARELNSLCFALAPVPIFLIWVYPFMKKWTWASHWVLGLTLGIAPYGAWLAVYPEWSLIPGLLTAAVLCWVSGFDIFYALQDADFDRSKGLFSLPASFGVNRAIFVAKCLQGFTIIALIAVGFMTQRGVVYWLGMAAVAGFIYREHRLVDRFGLAKINEVFFTMNACISIVVFSAALVDILI